MQAAHVNTFLPYILEMFASGLCTCLLCRCLASLVRQGRRPCRDEDSDGQPRLLFVQGNPRQSQEGNFHVHTWSINELSLWGEKKKKSILFYTGKGFLKLAMQASCFWSPAKNHRRSTTPFDNNWSLVTACWKNRQRWDRTLYLDVQNAVFTISLCFGVFNMGIISSS